MVNVKFSDLSQDVQKCIEETLKALGKPEIQNRLNDERLLSEFVSSLIELDKTKISKFLKDGTFTKFRPMWLTLKEDLEKKLILNRESDTDSDSHTAETAGESTFETVVDSIENTITESNIDTNSKSAEILQNIPSQLKKLNQFTCRGGIDGKTPLNPKTGLKAQWKDPNSLCSFDDACHFVANGKYEGISLAIRKENSIVVIDLDHVVSNGKIIDEKAREIVNSIGKSCYIEFSKSETGLHLFAYLEGDVPQWIRSSNGHGIKKFRGSDKIAYEIFTEDHLISPTGKIFGKYSNLGTINADKLDQTLRYIFQFEYTEFVFKQYRNDGKLQLPPVGIQIDSNLHIDSDIPINELLEAALTDPAYSNFAHVFQTGDSTAAGGRSERDFTLILQLLTLTNGDLDKTEYLFKQSACYLNPDNGNKKDPDPFAGIARKSDPDRYLSITIDNTIDRWNGHYFVPKSIWTKYIAKHEKVNAKPESVLVLPANYDATDSDNGQLIREKIPDLISVGSYDSEKYTLFDWQNSHFQKTSINKLATTISKIGDELKFQASKLSEQDSPMQKLLKAGAKKIKSREGMKNAVFYAAANDRFFTEEEINTSDDWFACANCYINTNPHSKDFLKVIAPDKSMHFTMSSSVEYRPGAKCPVFMATLERSLPDPHERYEFIKAVSRALFAGNPDHLFCFIYGLGANGKSTITKAVRNVLGDFAKDMKSDSLKFNPKREGSAPAPDIMHIRDARSVWTEEFPQKFQFDIGRIKSYSSGGRITERQLHKEVVEFVLKCSPFAITNERPNFPDENDDALFRRCIFFHFDQKIPIAEQDESLDQKLSTRAEREGILALLIEVGLIGYKTDGGLKPTQKMLALKDEIFSGESDCISKFFGECVQYEEGASISAKALTAAVKAWGNSLPPENEEIHKQIENCKEKTLATRIARFIYRFFDKKFPIYTRGAGRRYRNLKITGNETLLNAIKAVEKSLAEKRAAIDRDRYAKFQQPEIEID